MAVKRAGSTVWLHGVEDGGVSSTAEAMTANPSMPYIMAAQPCAGFQNVADAA
jgi:hypothetical protein